MKRKENPLLHRFNTTYDKHLINRDIWQLPKQ